MTEEMGILVMVLMAIVYASAISVGWGKRMDDDVATRPVILAGGVLIVIASYAWSKSNIQVFYDLLVWFSLAAIPLFIRSAILHFQQEDAKAHQREQEELKRYSVQRLFSQLSQRQFESGEGNMQKHFH